MLGSDLKEMLLPVRMVVSGPLGCKLLVQNTADVVGRDDVTGKKGGWPWRLSDANSY